MKTFFLIIGSIASIAIIVFVTLWVTRAQKPAPIPDPVPVEEDIEIPIPPDRKVSISGVIRVEDDDGSRRPFATDDFNYTVFVGNAQPQVLVKIPPPKVCAGEEVWVALDIIVTRINVDGDISISINGRLYEGTDCDNTDLDGTYSTKLTVPANATKEIRFTINNTDEQYSDDKADITLTVYNSVDS